MKLLSALVSVVALSNGLTASAEDSTKARVLGVAPYGRDQPYIIAIRAMDGKAADSAITPRASQEGGIGFDDFEIVAGEYSIMYRCASIGASTYLGIKTARFLADHSYYFTCSGTPAQLKLESVPNNSFKPNPLRGSA